MFPEDKFDIVALFQKKGHITGMTGDGVNDAPALRKANVGFAVEGATAAAQGAADCILLTPGLSVIITAIERSRKIFQRLQNYLIYRVFMSVYLLTFFFVAIAWADLDFPTLLIILMCLILDLSTMSLACVTPPLLVVPQFSTAGGGPVYVRARLRARSRARVHACCSLPLPTHLSAHTPLPRFNRTHATIFLGTTR